MKRLTRAQLEEAYKSVLAVLPEGTEISLDDIAEMYERAMSMGMMTEKQLKQSNDSSSLSRLAAVLKAGIQGGVPDSSETRAKRRTRMVTPLRDVVKGKLLAITNPKTIAATVKSWTPDEQAEALKMLQDPDFLQEYAGIKLKSQDGGAELITQMLFNKTKQMDAVQQHVDDNRYQALYNMFNSVTTLPDDAAIESKLKEFEEMRGQSEGFKRGLYDSFTSTRLNANKPEMRVRYKEALASAQAGQQSIAQAEWQKDQARLAAFQMQQAQVQTPEQRRHAAADWRTHNL